MWLVGNRRILGWWLGVAGQGGWAVFIVMYELWGLAPMWFGLAIAYTRNLVKWRRERREADGVR
jgi:hypothetical protein